MKLFKIKALWYKQRAAVYRATADEHRKQCSWHLQAVSDYEDRATREDEKRCDSP